VVGDPNIVSVDSYDVYLYGKLTGDLIANDPNFVGVTSTSVTAQSLSITPDPVSTYFWRVDSHVTWDSNDITGNFTDVIEGVIWTFDTLTAEAVPVVDIPVNNFVTWIDNLPETGLAATVDDFEEGDISLGDIDWTILNPPGGTHSVTDTSTNPLAPTASFTTDSAGVYTIQLTATDGLGQSDSDTVTITVMADACQAAQAVSGFSFNNFDSDDDCDVDLVDFAAFAAQWLDDINLTVAVPAE
jgi:hypothetical protein